jgi:glutamate transport system substrate-binding protein
VSSEETNAITAGQWDLRQDGKETAMRKSPTALAIILGAALCLGGCSGGGPRPNADPGDTTSSSPAKKTDVSAPETPSGEVLFDTSSLPQTLRIGVNFTYPNLGYYNGEKLEGFEIDLARYIAASLGYTEDEIEWIEAPSLLRGSLVKTGRVDMIIATYMETKQRQRGLDFAGPYIVAGQDLLVRQDETRINGPEDLAGLTVCASAGVLGVERLQADYSPEIVIVERSGLMPCIDALIAGDVDAVVTLDIVLAGAAHMPEYEGLVRVLGNPFSQEKVNITLPDKSPLCDPIEDALNQWIDSGLWLESAPPHLGEPGIGYPADVNPPALTPCG